MGLAFRPLSPRALRWLGALALVAVSAAAPHRAARAQSALGLDLGLYLDSISGEDDERIGPLHTIDRADRSNVNIVDGAVYYLYHLGDDERLGGFRVGGEFRYLGQYTTELDKGRDKDTQRIGTLFELGFRGDWTYEIVPNLGLTFGLRFDLAILSPDGDFDDQLRGLEDEGVPIGDGPRLGLAFVPEIGARYAIIDRLNLRFDVGLGYSYLDLISVDAGVQGIQYVRDVSVSSRRFEVSIGVELVL